MATLRLVALVVVVLVATAITSPWVAWTLEAGLGHPFTFGRVWNRVFEALLVVGLVVGWRRLDLGTLRTIGLCDEGWARRLGRGLVAGGGGLAVALVVCWVWGSVEPAMRFAPPKTLSKLLLGGGAAVAIGVGEEVLFRGVLLRRLSLDLGRILGVVATTGVFAAVHAIGRGHEAAETTLRAGVDRTILLLGPLVDGEVAPQLVGLALLGLLLAWARLRSGSLWLAIGIHAAWVAVFRMGRLLVEIHPWPAWLVGAGWPPLVGGAAGALAVGTTALFVLRLEGRYRTV